MNKIKLFLICALVMSGCCKEPSTAPSSHHQLTIDAGSADTKTQLSGDETLGFSAKWTAGDVIKVFQSAGGNVTSADSDPLEEDKSNAKFTASVEKVSGAVAYSAVYPASAVAQESKSWTITMPSEQTCKGGSFDANADILIAKSAEFSSQQSELHLGFVRLGAVMRITVTGLAEDEKVCKASISSDGAILAGKWTWNPSSSEAEIKAEGSSNITVNCSDNLVVARVMPVTTMGFAVLIETNKGKYAKTYSDMITFAENTVNCFTFDASTASAPIEGSGTQSDPYIIKTVEELKSISGRLILDEATYFELGNDIDLAEEENWAPLNPSANNMRIDLDGKGFTIRNMHCNNSGTYTSFMGLLAGEIRNLNFDNCSVVSKSPAGIVCGWCGISNASFSASLNNVHVTNSSVKSDEGLTAQLIIGGAVGRCGGATITNCSFQGSVSNSAQHNNSFTGGFVGEVNNKSSLKDIKVNATVENNGGRYCGGIVGSNSCPAQIENAEFKGTVTGAYDVVGGAVGGTLGGTIKNVSVVADISGGTTPGYTGSNYYSYTGGIVGLSTVSSTYNVAATIENCSYSGKIVSTGKCVGGISGQFSQETQVNGCTVDGSMEARQFAGGICGYLQKISMASNNCTVKMPITISEGYLGGHTGMTNTGAEVSITNFNYEGNITGKSSYVAGVVGRINTGTVSLNNCCVKGDITSTSGIGGMIGDVTSNATYESSADISHCSYEGTITGTTNVAGILGKLTRATNAVTARIDNCFSTGAINATSNYVAGISGCLTSESSVRNCYSTCSIKGNYGLGGIVTRTCNLTNLGDNYAVNNNITVEYCIAWNPSITTVNSSKIDPGKNYSAGAVVGYSATLNTLKKCWRRSDMSFDYYITAEQNSLTDNEDADASNPLTKLDYGKYSIPYNGKAADSGATVSSIAQSLGWDNAVWDFTNDLPSFKK